VQALLAASRSLPNVPHGLSPRAGIGLLAASRAWALCDGRDHVRPDDVQAVLPSVAGHRLQAHGAHQAGDELSRILIESVRLG
jgi:MoxR-like ATPase